MTTGSDAVPPYQSAAAASNADLPTNDSSARAGTPQPDEESDVLQREGLPPDAMILAPSVAATPMRHLKQVCAMLVLAVDVLDDTDPDREGRSPCSLAAGFPINLPPASATVPSYSC